MKALTAHQVFIDSDHSFRSQDHDGNQRSDPDSCQEGVKVLVADHPPGALHRQRPLALAAGRVLDHVPRLLNVDAFHLVAGLVTIIFRLFGQIRSFTKIVPNLFVFKSFIRLKSDFFSGNCLISTRVSGCSRTEIERHRWSPIYSQPKNFCLFFSSYSHLKKRQKPEEDIPIFSFLYFFSFFDKKSKQF